MRKSLFLLCLLSTICKVDTIDAQVINDFEGGLTATAGAEFRNQSSTSFSIFDCELPPLFGSAITPAFTAFNMGAERASIVTAGNEPILQSHGLLIPRVGPSGGNFALRLNNITSGNQDITGYTETFTVSEPHLSFDYLAVLDSDHTDNLEIQPFFSVRLLDMNNQLIDDIPVCVVADPDEPLLADENNTVFYTSEWFCGLVNIPHEYIGEQIQVQFVVADCGASGHRGVVYLDNIVNAKKCDEPALGFIDLDPLDEKCNPEKLEITGTFAAPFGSTFTDASIVILQNGVEVPYNPASMSAATFSGGNFAFGFNVYNSGLPDGGYEIRVVAHFTAPNGFVYELIDQSTNLGADFYLGDSDPLNVNIIINEGGGLYFGGAEWDDLGEVYYIEAIADGTCCPNRWPQSSMDPFIFSTTTTQNSLGNTGFSIANAINSKCYRFRVRTECKEWSEWCCVTSYNWTEGGYNQIDPNDPFNICLEEIVLNNSTAIVYPNPTSGMITVSQSRSLNFEVYDLQQNLVLSKSVNSPQEKVELDLSNVPAGIYLLKTDEGEHKIKVVK
ncbi:T9SS type A sorting domain-containing protein [Avrilella dinanensis]|uniref:T9SS type A sorting domain-containing protein n=1 Tax=Avrilella dinanensis TaxID=2008672 RepID=UPI00240988F8|nr:T9SS type A sorting domain-containing protein [Avrilella dinanensis]